MCEDVEWVDKVFCEELILTSFVTVSIPVVITAVLVVWHTGLFVTGKLPEMNASQECKFDDEFINQI